jgi:ubiquinone/menaquinone biosynthesis C-methylase UbiE
MVRAEDDESKETTVSAMRDDTDKLFSGSIPQLYEQHLVPLIFQPYAADMAGRVAQCQPSAVLEIAAGTGVVTRELAKRLAPDVQITATDLNEPMLAEAAAAGTARTVEWRQADAMQLPFGDGMFDIVVCQFGAMFFPEKPAAFSEVRRVLRPGGTFLFNVWDRIEENEFADVVTTSLQTLFPEDPPRFMRRTPHGYFDTGAIRSDLAGAGFRRTADIATLAARSRADSPRVPAIAYCQGTPLQNEIIARGPSRLGEATDIVAEAIARRFGRGAVDAKIQAHVIVVES